MRKPARSLGTASNKSPPEELRAKRKCGKSVRHARRTGRSIQTNRQHVKYKNTNKRQTNG